MIESSIPSVSCSLRQRTSVLSLAPASPTRTKSEHHNPNHEDTNFPENHNDSLQRGSARTTNPNRPSPHSAQHERPWKRVKLDDTAGYNGSRSPEPPGKLPLRGKEVEAPMAARRSRRALSNTTLNMPPPQSTQLPSESLPHSSKPAGDRSTRASHPKPPVTVNEDAGEPRKGALASQTDGAADDTTHVSQSTGPSAVGSRARGEKRSLRSHDGGSRSKSELAMYFPNYEQVLSLEPTKQEFLSPDTAIFLVDDLSEPLLPKSDPSEQSDARNNPAETNPLQSLHNVQTIDLSIPEDEATQFTTDPLSNDVYFKSHRRIERQEKQLRNIERERAQHEKIQLDRILAELQGHDWLRVMGISGITDSEKKLYEPKRAYFVREVSTLIDKFKAWKEEEKRRKLEKDQLLAAEEGEEDNDDEEEEDEEDHAGKNNEHKTTDSVNRRMYPGKDESLPDIDDVDGWAAHQLQLEAMTASRKRSKTEASSSQSGGSGQRRQPHTLDQPPPPPPPEPETPFTSFFDKPHQRAAALGQSRRGRTRMAFGQHLPEMPEREFQLPDYILTEEAIVAARRRNRRKRREQSKK